MRTPGKIIAGLAAAATLLALMGPTGGFPSRPTFQDVTLRQGTPAQLLTETDGAADNKNWRMRAASEQLQFAALTDALGGPVNWLTVDRTGTQIDAITFTPLEYVTVSSLSAGAIFTETDGALDNKNWRVRAASEQLQFAALTDALGGPVNWLTVDRTGTTVDAINLVATAVQTNGVDITAVSGSYTGSFTGFTTTPTATIEYRRSGNVVALTIGAASGTSNATTFTITGAPAAIRPASATGIVPVYRCTNATVDVYGTCGVDMSAGGTLTLYLSGSSLGWTASGTKGVPSSMTISYGLN